LPAKPAASNVCHGYATPNQYGRFSGKRDKPAGGIYARAQQPVTLEGTNLFHVILRLLQTEVIEPVASHEKANELSNFAGIAAA
jgi:hypothetical protein